MPATIQLTGMTWSDPRGYDPMVAASSVFREKFPDVEIVWDKRSLQGFESTPVEDLAQAYDLMVIDHPHVGEAARKSCLRAFDVATCGPRLTAIAAEAVGRSYESYQFEGRQWALPLDAAAQVQALRPDLTPRPLRRFDDILALAREGHVLWPLRPPHVLMSYFTFAANLGAPCAVTPGPALPRPLALKVLGVMQTLADRVDPACFAMDPIAALDALAESAHHCVAPHVYLYTGYSRAGYRPNLITFHDIPALGASGPLGSTLGGTGVAISARTKHPLICEEFALWIAGAETQAGLYATHNGQPGNGRAWGDPDVNASVAEAYNATRMTHEAAWIRPRHAGYMAFQEEGSSILIDALRARVTHAAALDAFDRRFLESFTHG